MNNYKKRGYVETENKIVTNNYKKEQLEFDDINNKNNICNKCKSKCNSDNSGCIDLCKSCLFDDIDINKDNCSSYCNECLKKSIAVLQQYAETLSEATLEQAKLYSQQLFSDYINNNNPSNMSILQATTLTQTLPSANNLAFSTTYSIGSNIGTPANTLYTLAGDHVYQVSITTTGSVISPGYFSVIPEINGIARPEYGATVVNSVTQSAVSTTSNFIISTKGSGTVFLDFLITANSNIAAITGNVSIIQLS